MGPGQPERNGTVAYVFLGKDENAQEDMDRAEELGMDHGVIRAACEKAKRSRPFQPRL